MNGVSSKHWDNVSGKWSSVGPPLRPTLPDMVFFSQAIRKWTEENKSPRCLILGVTPEYYHHLKPVAGDLVAVDYSPQMIRTLWPGPQGSALCADWNQLPLRNESRDVVITDGGLNLIRYPDEQGQVARNLRRIVPPGGICLFRLFWPPAVKETPTDIVEYLKAGNISNVNMLKFRLWMSFWKSPAIPVLASEIWNLIEHWSPDLPQILKKINWPSEGMNSFQVYRNSSLRFYFFGLEDLLRIYSAEGFDLEETHTPDYSSGHQFQTILLRRRD